MRETFGCALDQYVPHSLLPNESQREWAINIVQVFLSKCQSRLHVLGSNTDNAIFESFIISHRETTDHIKIVFRDINFHG